MKSLPLLAALSVVLAGIAAAGLFHHWRVGGIGVGVGLLLGAALRLALPARRAGLLVVRSRAADASVLLLLGVAAVALTNTIPRH